MDADELARVLDLEVDAVRKKVSSLRERVWIARIDVANGAAQVGWQSGPMGE